MKKVLIIMALILVTLSLCTIVVLADQTVVSTNAQNEEKADILKDMGLFKGTDIGYELDRKPTRIEALVMLIRLLGKEEEALNTTATHPFKDIATWSDKYVAYAYQNKLTNGISATEFAPNNIANSNMYLTFVLRALGYTDVDKQDFYWETPNELATKVGILDKNVDLTNFNRADVVKISYNSLNSNMKNTTTKLYTKLSNEKAIKQSYLYTLVVDEGSRVLQNNQTYELKKGAKLQIKNNPDDFVSQIEYYWDEYGISKKTTVNSGKTTITIPDDFTSNQQYILYVRVKDLANNYTEWKAYKIKALQSEDIEITVKTDSTTLSRTKENKYETGTSLTITATPKSKVQKLQYYWDEDGSSSKTTVSSYTKTITIPTKFEEGEKYVLYVRVLDDDDNYTSWVKYNITIGEPNIGDGDISLTVKAGTTVLSRTSTNSYETGTSLKITATPSDKVQKLQYYWDEDGSSSKTTVSSYTKTITIPTKFEEGEKYVLYIRVLDEDNEYTDWVKYSIKIGSKSNDEDIEITVKAGTKTLSTTRTNSYETGTSLKITATPSSNVSKLQYYWDVNGSSSKVSVSSYTKTITIPDDFEKDDIYILYVRTADKDGVYTGWVKYEIKISDEQTTNDGETSLTLSLKKGTTTLSTTKTNKYEVGTQLTITTSSSKNTDSVEYYWSDNGSNSKVTVSGYTTTIAIPNTFAYGEQYKLFVRAKDTDGDYTSWYEYTFEIPQDTNFAITLKHNSNSIDNAKQYELEKGETLKLQVTPISNVSRIQYHWDDSTQNTSVSSYKADIKIPTTYTAGTTHKLSIRVENSDGKYTDYIVYNFKIVIDIDSVELNKTSLELKVGEEETLTATVTPSNATYANITWVSKDESVATVDENGKVTALKAGETKIIAITENDISKTCNLTVTEAE